MKLLLLFFFNLYSFNVYAASCCGGGFAQPSIISGDEKALFTQSLSFAETKSEVYSNGIWRDLSDSERAWTLKLEAAHIFWDRYQTGLTLPLIQKSQSNESSTGFGDISWMLGYEYLPDWDYNPYRPKGVGYFQLVLPTGKSIQESDTALGVDSRGRGFWSLGAGSLLTKAWGNYDVFINFDIHRSLNKKTEGLYLKPGWGGSVGAGAGYSFKNWRWGGAVSWAYEDPIDVEGISLGSLQRYSTASLVTSYMLSELYALSVTYSDQTLVGSPTNTSLARSVLISFQRKWLR